MNLKSKSGFTLIELLVVVAIIGLLASVVLASLNSARSKARDAKRKSDLYNIRLALEMYYDAYGTYPPPKPQTSCGGTDVWADSKGTCGGQWLTTDSNFYTFMGSVPVDPLNTGTNASGGDGNYVYSYYTSDNYNLLAQLENTGDKISCGITPAYYHSSAYVPPNPPWCAPWPNNLGRSQNIISDHL